MLEFLLSIPLVIFIINGMLCFIAYTCEDFRPKNISDKTLLNNIVISGIIVAGILTTIYYVNQTPFDKYTECVEKIGSEHCMMVINVE